MHLLYDSIQDLVFKRTSNWNFKSVSLSGTMIRILCSIDGINPVSSLKEAFDLSEAELIGYILRLSESGLIEKAPVAHLLNSAKSQRHGIYRGVPFDVAAR